MATKAEILYQGRLALSTAITIKKLKTTTLGKIAVLGGVCCAASTASATPPDIIDIRDTPVAVSDNTLFVERRTNDNMGNHHEQRVELFLVAMALDGDAENIWPTYGAIPMKLWHKQAHFH